MRRFAYYFVVNVALLAGYLSWLILQLTGFKEPSVAPDDMPVETKRRPKPKRREGSRAGRQVFMALGVIAVFFLVFFPNIGKAVGTASAVPFAPSNAWCESLSWLKDNTPEPFGNPDYYYELYKEPPSGESYTNPETAYGVTAWWDYGYWITRIGHRIPTSNPGTGAAGEQFIFTAQDEASANKILDQWGSKYVIVDHDISTIMGGKFHALATLSGSNPDKFFGIYYQLTNNTLEPIILFYPEYYRSLVVRLYNFDGKNVIPRGPVVISYQEKVTPDGQYYRQITSVQSFDSYAEAQNYVISQKSGNYRIVSGNPYASPVPLPAVEHYRLIYTSKSLVAEPGIGTVPEVKIFEYTK
jgi:dolichyl-diphosphooligosaccharide--protein glycosyltransferase